MLTSFLFAASFSQTLNTMLFIGLGILGLGLVIFVHELGHFIVAKMCGVKCEKFYVGFDPPLKYLPSALFKKKIGETEYGIGIIPLGGYVKMLGQDENPANAAKEAQRIRIARENQGQQEADELSYEIDPRSFPAKPVWQRLLIISAGVVFNLIFAVIFAMIAFRVGVKYTPCIVSTTSPGLSGWKVGLQPGDHILQISRDGTPNPEMRFSEDLVIPVIMEKRRVKIDLLVKRFGKSEDEDPEWITVDLTGSKKEEGRGYIGIAPAFQNKIRAEIDSAYSNIPAAKADIKIGDSIVGFNGEEFGSKDPSTNFTILSRKLANHVDDEIELIVERPG